MSSAISEEIDIIRGTAALGVILGHCLYSFYPITILGRTRYLFTPIDGSFWVWIFFIISGYLQGYAFFAGGYPLSYSGSKKYWMNRGLRILPLFYLIMAIALVFHSAVNSEPIDWMHVGRQCCFLTSDYSLVGPLWSIAVEIHFYFLVPFLCAFYDKYSHKVFPSTLSCVLFSLGCCVIVRLIFASFDNMLQPRLIMGNLGLFICGLCIAKFRLSPQTINPHLKLYLILSLMAFTWILHIENDWFWKGGGALMAILISYLLLAFDGKYSITHFFPFRMLRFVGRYCYGVYVYAALIGVFYTIGWHLRPSLLALALQLMGIPVAFVSYHVFEKHILRLKRTISVKRIVTMPSQSSKNITPPLATNCL